MDSANLPLYLDHHAITPPSARVVEFMHDARGRAWGNPSSTHRVGREARALMETARRKLADAIGARPSEIVFTAGGTEACNLGVLGLSHGQGPVICSALEHPAVRAPLETLGRAQLLRVEGDLPPGPEHLLEAIEVLGAAGVALQWVNHETGAISPVAEYGRACLEKQAPLFVDATQALGKIPVDVTECGAKMLAIASSKIGGPPAVGALWVASGFEVFPRQVGGGQERGRRAGSPDPVAIAGFGEAVSALGTRLESMARIGRQRDELETFLLSEGAVLNGPREHRVSTVTNVSVPGWKGARLVAALDLEGLCASSGAACSSGLDSPSTVISAMYPNETWRAEAALRLSLGTATTDADISMAIEILRRVLRRKQRS